MEQENISYGKYLKSIREEKGISIDQIVRESKIPLDILIAIENEDRERLPDEVFIRGFIRIYSEIAGADAGLAVSLFNDHESHKKKEKSVVSSSDELTREKNPFMKQIFMFLVFVSIILGSYYGFQYINNGHTDKKVPVVEAPLSENGDIPMEGEGNITPETAETVETVETAETAETAETDETAISDQSDIKEAIVETEETTVVIPDVIQEETRERKKPDAATLKLKIECIEKTWLKIIIDSEKPVEHVMQPDDTINLEADTAYNILIGNATGVKLELDGRHIPVPGKSGQVVNINLP